jgi:hypothetical protein
MSGKGLCSYDEVFQVILKKKYNLGLDNWSQWNLSSVKRFASDVYTCPKANGGFESFQNTHVTIKV